MAPSAVTSLTPAFMRADRVLSSRNAPGCRGQLHNTRDTRGRLSSHNHHVRVLMPRRVFVSDPSNPASWLEGRLNPACCRDRGRLRSDYSAWAEPAWALW